MTDHVVEDATMDQAGAVQARPLRGVGRSEEGRACRGCGRSLPAASRVAWGRCCRWTRHRATRPVKYVWTPEKDEFLRARYVAGGRGSGRGSVRRIAAALNFPAWAVSNRAAELGLRGPRGKVPRWTDEEIRFLEESAGARPAYSIARSLGRSIAAVRMQLKRMGISSRFRDGYTIQDIEACFGVSNSTVYRWLRLGLLKGTRPTVMGTPVQGHVWRFSEEAVRRFIKKNPREFDLKHVDQTWFLDLVFSRPVKEEK